MSSAFNSIYFNSPSSPNIGLLERHMLVSPFPNQPLEGAEGPPQGRYATGVLAQGRAMLNELPENVQGRWMDPNVTDITELMEVILEDLLEGHDWPLGKSLTVRQLEPGISSIVSSVDGKETVVLTVDHSECANASIDDLKITEMKPGWVKVGPRER